MSTVASQVGSNSSVQLLAQNVLQQFDLNGDGQLSVDEFGQFLNKLIDSLSSNSVSSATSTTSTTPPKSTAAATAALAAATSTDGGYTFYGFDASRAQSAAGSLKYDAYNVLKKYNPADPTSMQKAYQELNAMHPGQYQLDSSNNLMLTGTADGYIGARPDDRNSDWSNYNQPWNWSWFAYNSAHPGPNGETS
ncbi:MAG: hypothetical protein KGN76_00265 [Acidobacteriota bacterium]|nr:hypothetical protein [Acidobacteriota bacterium]